jgi:hypothetical protein
MLKSLYTLVNFLLIGNLKPKGENMKKIISIMMILCLTLSGLIIGQLFYSSSVSAPDPDLPDLEISQENITISSTNPIVGESIDINATIWNMGNADAENITVNFYEEDELIGSKVIHIPVNISWSINTLDSTGSIGGDSSIAVDDEKGIHISYGDSTNLDLKYAYKPNGGDWGIYSIDTLDDVGRYTSLDLDSANGVHISYYDDTNDDLKYAYKANGGSWDIQTIDAVDNVGFGCSLVVDSSDGIHISYGYYDGIDYDLKYIHKPSGGSWTNQTVDSFGNVTRSSIAVDDSGGVHISYHNTTIQDETKLKYAYKPNGGGWSFYTIDNIGSNSDLTTSLAIDDGKGVHVSYHEETNDDLKYAYKPNGGDWTNYTVDSSGSVGSWNSLAMDGSNGVHISYRDWSNKDLKYAYKPDGGNWTTYYVDSPDDIGMETSIAVNQSNAAHISYLNWQERDLKYAYQIIPPGNLQVSFSWIPSSIGARNLTMKIDENNEIEEYDETNNEVYVDVTVEPGPLARIEVEPFLASLELNDTLQYSAKGYDAYDNELYISPVWNVSGGGIIYQSGFFIAKYPGNWTVYANDSGISGYAIVYALLNDSLDNDFDGIPNGWEVDFGLDPFNASDAFVDMDFDGLSNLQEYLNGSQPRNNDTDGDNLGDGFEVIFSKTEPDIWDTNGNAIGDGLEFIQSKGYLGWIESLPDDWIGMTITWDNYTILIKTNSSVLEGEFDKEEQKLKIKVSGEEGTQGVTEIQIPKGLCDPMDIEISLDGELINYTVTEDETYFYIHVEYNHSVHELSAHFGESEVIEDPTDGEEEFLAGIYILFLIIALVAVLLLLIIVRHRSGGDIGVQELPPEQLSALLDKKHDEGKISDETYNDAISLLEKYRGD